MGIILKYSVMILVLGLLNPYLPRNLGRAGQDIPGDLNVSGEVIFNEDGNDKDFRVEGVGDANALFVRGSDSTVMIGGATPQGAKLATYGNIRSLAGNFIIDNNQRFIGRDTTDTPRTILKLDSNDQFDIGPDGSPAGTTTKLILKPGTGVESKTLTITEDGDVGIGTWTPSYKLDVTGTGDFSGSVIVGGALIPSKVVADPCGAYAEGSIFYNDTSNYMCYCDGTNDVKMHDPTAACF